MVDGHMQAHHRCLQLLDDHAGIAQAHQGPMLSRWPLSSRVTPSQGKASPEELKLWKAEQARKLQPSKLLKIRLQQRESWRFQLYKRILAPVRQPDLQQAVHQVCVESPPVEDSSTATTAHSQPADRLATSQPSPSLQSEPQGLQEAAATIPQGTQQQRRRLFAQKTAAQWQSSAALRKAFIPKVAACKSWKPRLSHKLLPKYLAVLDGPCTAFLLRHLVKIQPSPELGLWRCISHQPTALQQHLQLYLQQPRPGPGAWPSPSLQHILAHQLTRHQPVNPRTQQVPRQERSDFHDLVLSVCVVSTHKLHRFSSGVMGSCAAALGDLLLGDQQVPGAFWAAWEAATLPFLHRTSRRLQAMSRARRWGPSAAVRVRVWLLHVGRMVVGAARCGHTPSPAWQAALWAVLHQATRQPVWHTAALCDVFEAWALLSVKHTAQQQQQQQQRDAGAAVVHSCWCPDARALGALLTCLRARVAAVSVQRAGPRLLVSALLALAAHQSLAVSVNKGDVVALDEQHVQEFAGWWLETAAGVQAQMTAAHAACSLWSLMCLSYGQISPDSQIAIVGQRCKWNAEPWIARVVQAHLGCGPTTTPYTVHIMLLLLLLLLPKAPPPQAIAHRCLVAFKHTLPGMSIQQLLDCLSVLHAWRLRLPPGHVATLAVYITSHAEHMALNQHTRLLGIIAGSSIVLPPACVRALEQAVACKAGITVQH